MVDWPSHVSVCYRDSDSFSLIRNVSTGDVKHWTRCTHVLSCCCYFQPCTKLYCCGIRLLAVSRQHLHTETEAAGRCHAWEIPFVVSLAILRVSEVSYSTHGNNDNVFHTGFTSVMALSASIASSRWSSFPIARGMRPSLKMSIFLFVRSYCGQLKPEGELGSRVVVKRMR